MPLFLVTPAFLFLLSRYLQYDFAKSVSILACKTSLVKKHKGTNADEA